MVAGATTTVMVAGTTTTVMVAGTSPARDQLVPIPACSREREEALKAPPLAEELLAVDG